MSADVDPYLQQLLHDPELAQAANAGPHALYRALIKKRRSLSDTASREAIDRILGNRRIFLSPIKSAPGMYTLNGVGSKIYGSSERGDDGTYVSTLFFVFLFIPIFPIGQYLIRDAGGNRYTFFGKVPLSRTMALWRVLAGACVLALGLAIGGAIWQSQQSSPVWLVNGLDVPVNVRVAEFALQLPANGKQSVQLDKGPHHVTFAGIAGATIEEQDVDVPGGYDLVVVNVLGAAPIYVEEVIYTTSESAAREPNHTLHMGERFIARDGVRFVFTTPPETMEVSSGASERVEHRAEIAPGGWKLTFNILTSGGKLAEAADLARRVSLLTPEDEDGLARAIQTTGIVAGSEGVLEYLQQFIAAHPGSIPGHRAYQHQMIHLGKRAEVTDKYRAAWEAARDSATAGYLYARLLADEQALPLYVELSTKFPQDLWIMRGLGWRLFQQRRFSESLPYFEMFTATAPLRSGLVLSERTRALVALGRIDDALALVNDYATKYLKDAPAALLYARVALLAGEGKAPHPPEYYLQEKDDEEKRVLAAWFLGLKSAPSDAELAAIEPAELRSATQIDGIAPRDRAKGLELVHAADEDTLRHVDPSLLLLLAGELLRAGEEDQFARIVKSNPDTEAIGPAIKARILSGAESVDLTDLDLELRAALELAHARKLGATREGKQLLERARADDVLHGPVTIAAQSWKL